MPRTPRMKLARTEKQKAADKRNLEAWEKKQAEEARISNDKEVAEIAHEEGYKEGYDKGQFDGYQSGYEKGNSDGFVKGLEENKRLAYVNMLSGFVLGSVTVLIAAFICLGL